MFLSYTSIQSDDVGQWPSSAALIVKFQQISNIVLVFPLLLQTSKWWLNKYYLDYLVFTDSVNSYGKFDGLLTFQQFLCCCHVWAGAPSCYLELLDKLQNGYVGLLVLHLTVVLSGTLGSLLKCRQLKSFLDFAWHHPTLNNGGGGESDKTSRIKPPICLIWMGG